MKFFSAIILLAVAISANASAWGPAGPSLSVSGPWGGHWNGAGWAGAPWAGAWDAAPWGAAPWGAAPWAGAHWGAHGAAVVAAHAHAAPTPVASYVAANRGSAHSAPLIGHTVSVKSLNVDPAPGTW